MNLSRKVSFINNFHLSIYVGFTMPPFSSMPGVQQAWRLDIQWISSAEHTLLLFLKTLIMICNIVSRCSKCFIAYMVHSYTLLTGQGRENEGSCTRAVDEQTSRIPAQSWGDAHHGRNQKKSSSCKNCSANWVHQKNWKSSIIIFLMELLHIVAYFAPTVVYSILM